MEISEFGWIFESIAESSQKLRKRIHDSQLVSFILASGTERAIEFFHRLDKHQSGILSLREFVFGMMELKLPPGITLKDVTKFAQVEKLNVYPPVTTNVTRGRRPLIETTTELSALASGQHSSGTR